MKLPTLLRRLSITFLLMLIFSPAGAARASADDDPILVLMTLNVYNHNDDVQALSEVIRASGADVVLLQEITDAIDVDLPAALADVYTYTSIHTLRPRRLGLGVLSRYPLLADDFSAYQPESSRLRVQIKVDGRVVTIYNVHLANPLQEDRSYDSTARSEGISGLLEMVLDEETPLVVAGDFNMTDFDDDYARVTERLIDSFAESGEGFGFTFPAWSPIRLARLDYVFHSDELISTSAEVGDESGGSDHLPLSVELAWQASST